jgi:site-specific DNA-methyltransferase (adenine-specific)
MQIQYIEIDHLIPYERNPRKNDQAVDAVAASIKEFGFKVPIVIDSNNIIVAGHTRYKAAKTLGMDTVPCIIADDLTDEQVRAFRLVDNKTSELAEWDLDLLAIELDDISTIDMGMFGFEDAADDKEAVEDDYEITLPKQPQAKMGDIYQLGNHRVMCGDSTNEQHVAMLMEDALADNLQTDPPYNVDYGSKAEAINSYGYHFSDRHIENDYMPSAEFTAFLTDAFANAERHMKPGATFYIWHASITVLEFETALRTNKLRTRQQIIWNKNSIVLSRQDYHWKHEPCLYGWKEGAAHYFTDCRKHSTVIEDAIPKYKQMKKDEIVKLLDEIYADRISTTVINEDKPSVSAEHPTMKPIKVLARMMLNSTKPGNIVMDLFGGSGSTLITAEQLGRTCYMMEFDPKYVDVIIDRWEKFTGRKAEKIA